MNRHQFKLAFRAYRQMLHTVDWSNPSTYVYPREFGINTTPLRASTGYLWENQVAFRRYAVRLALATMKRDYKPAVDLPC